LFREKNVYTDWANLGAREVIAKGEGMVGRVGGGGSAN